MISTATANEIKLGKVAPHFAVADVVATAEYYCHVLGFNLLGYFLDPPVFAMVARDGAELHFGQEDAGQSAVPNSSFRSIGVDAYIFVENVVGLAGELSARGAEIIEGPVERVYGCTEFIIRDCNGYKIAFGE
jgi:predicted enzyme related to lactoylglutathione lyase